MILGVSRSVWRVLFGEKVDMRRRGSSTLMVQNGKARMSRYDMGMPPGKRYSHTYLLRMLNTAVSAGVDPILLNTPITKHCARERNRLF